MSSTSWSWDEALTGVVPPLFEALLASSVLQGGDGFVPRVANVAPRLCVDVLGAARRGDAPRAASLQDRVTDLARLYEQGSWLPALKAACAHLGLGNVRPAPPLLAAAASARAAIAALVDQHRPRA